MQMPNNQLSWNAYIQLSWASRDLIRYNFLLEDDVLPLEEQSFMLEIDTYARMITEVERHDLGLDLDVELQFLKMLHSHYN